MPKYSLRRFMLLPTMACQASCRYCFAKKTGEVMSRATAESAIDFIQRTAPRDGGIYITFHGGEPLLAGEAFYAWLLPRLADRFGRRLRLSIQSNLWAMTDGLAELFRRYRVTVGTSVDGPASMCDAQRGPGYHARTKAGEELLKRHDVSVGEICTFAAGNEGCAAEVFRESRFPYAIHGAVPTLGGVDSGISLDAAQMARVLLDSYDAYRADPAHSRVSTIDSMVRGCFNGKGDTCTFFDCLGTFAAIAPDGGVYSCQRFCGLEDYCFGFVQDGLTETDMLNSTACRRLRAAQDGKRAACGDCEHWGWCMGGCLYNSLAAGIGKDPYCESYRALFDRIRLDMALEMGEVMLGRGASTPVLAMAGDRPHPWDAARNRERLKQAIEKGRLKEPWAEALRSPWPQDDLNKLYLHVTFDCPLRCPHCYAEGGERKKNSLPPEQFAGIIKEAVERRFRAVVITGGEPLTWPGFDALCAGLTGLDRKGVQLVLRTSFGFDIPPEHMWAIAELFDEIVVSVDGDRVTHDARRGAGRYDRTVKNLEAASALGAKLSLATTLDQSMCEGAPGDSVRALARRLGIEKVRFRPVLPLGRGSGEAAEWQLCGEEVSLENPFRPRHSCGLGQNLYIEPDGAAYPCYAWCSPEAKLGDLGREGLGELLDRGGLYEYCRHDVDSNAKCKSCEVRYLCGGVCKAWVRDKRDIDSGDFDCSSRKEYFMRLIQRIDEED